MLDMSDILYKLYIYIYIYIYIYYQYRRSSSSVRARTQSYVIIVLADERVLIAILRFLPLSLAPLSLPHHLRVDRSLVELVRTSLGGARVVGVAPLVS